MADSLEILHRFANNVAAAMNGSEVEPPEGARLAAVLVVVQTTPVLGAPMGASLNFDHDTKRWDVTPQASLCTPARLNDHDEE